MKSFIYTLTIMLLLACKSKAPILASEEIKNEEKIERLVKLTTPEINSVKLNRAYSIGKRLLEACNTSQFKKFSTTEATDKVIANASQKNITKTCQKIKHRNGKFIDLKLLEVNLDNQTNDVIFKYDIDYEKKLFRREITIIVNADDKVSSITTKEISKIF
jgi:hypothetical protein